MAARRKKGNKYTRLISNTLLFGVSTFSSKVLSFVLTRLYTGVLAEASYGVVDLVTACANLLIPLVSLGISHAIIRFGLEKGVSRNGVFTSGLAAIGLGFAALLALYPLVASIPLVSSYAFLLYAYVLISCLRTMCCQFVRARQFVRLYAIDGILSTVYTVGFNLLFLVALQMGPVGYLLAIIAADALSAFGLFMAACLWQYIQFKNFGWALFKSMLRYCLPLVPALMFWWVTNASDRFFISLMRSPAENGLYAAAYKVPTIVTVFSTIFTEAWQLSAVTDGQDAGRETFFSHVFQSLSAVVFLAGGALIFSCRLIMRFLVAPAYFAAWEYVPILVCATVFSCLVAFLNSVYMVEKKSGQSLLTMLMGAGVNILLNWWFIPGYGAQGAAFATFLSYVLVFVIRAGLTRRLIRISLLPGRLLGGTALLAGMAFTMAAAPARWQLWCALFMAGLVLINAPSLYKGILQLIRRRGARREGNG